MKRILVTGGAGFIGSHLCERLLNEGHYVISLDNYFSGQRQNIQHLLKHPQFEEVTHDVNEPFDIAIDEIYNLATPASPIYYQANPVRTVTTNVMGTLHMLRLAKRKSARILQASTSEVYGDPTVHPQSEKYLGNVNPIGPRACYDEGKRCAETLCFDYHREQGVEIKVVRIFNTYGPRMRSDDGRVVSNFIVQALEEKPITIYGNGQQTRSFCYVDDMIEGMVRAMNSDASFVGPVNLGNPHEVTVLELAEAICAEVGIDLEVTKKPLPHDDPVQRCPDIQLALKKLNWQPSVHLNEGLADTVAYFKEVLGYDENEGKLAKSS